MRSGRDHLKPLLIFRTALFRTAQGAVNLSVDTMAVPDGIAAAALVAYMAAVCAAASIGAS
jgi:hypothetical protein